MTTSTIGTVRRADQPEDYARFGVNQAAIEPREDGMRESASAPGTFEWWYFEVGLPDRTAIVVAFLTKPLDQQAGEWQPLVSIRIRFPDEPESRGGDFPADPQTFVASRDLCYVQAGGSSCRYQGQGKYLLDLREGDIAGTIEINGVVPPARIGTGHLLFLRGGDAQYLGWLVPVPFGMANVDLTVGGRSIQGTGGGYHDHNWGDHPMAEPIHHWYWGRAVVDGFVVIAANTVARPAYGSVDHTDLVLLKDGRFIALGDRNASFAQTAIHTDPVTGKPVADVTTYRFVDAGGIEYLATFRRHHTVLARVLGGAAYHRFAGEFTLQIEGGPVSETHRTDKVTWELMWFGDAPAIEGLKLYTSMLSEPAGS